jgi:hypothetical protein
MKQDHVKRHHSMLTGIHGSHFSDLRGRAVWRRASSTECFWQTIVWGALPELGIATIAGSWTRGTGTAAAGKGCEGGNFRSSTSSLAGAPFIIEIGREVFTRSVIDVPGRKKGSNSGSGKV